MRNEVAEAWRVVLSAKHRPACLILTRQTFRRLDRSRFAPASGLARGGLRVGGSRWRSSPDHPDRDRERGARFASVRPSGSPRKARPRASLACLLVGALRTAGRGLSRVGSAGRDRSAGGGRAGSGRRLGSAMWGAAVRWSECTPLVPQRRSRGCSRSSASLPSMSSKSPINKLQNTPAERTHAMSNEKTVEGRMIEPAPEAKPGGPCTMVIFGAGGDLHQATGRSGALQPRHQ